MKITLDTNILSADDLISSCKNCGWDFAVVSVTEREVEGTSYQVKIKPIGKILETGVWNESRWGEAVWGSKKNQDVLNDILNIISRGSYPIDRSELTSGHKRQLRDAMIFEAHVREGRDIFVTNDRRAFINDGRREKFQERFHTKIMTREELIALCNE